MATNTVSIKSIDDKSAIVAGWGVIYGGRDLDGDTFTAQTDFALDSTHEPPVFYDHTLGDVQHQLGRVVKISAQEAGLWIEAQIERATDYAEQVLKLIEKGVLGWSSGSVSHLVRREGKTIKSWPIYEFSLTPTPAEPRTLGVEQIKRIDGLTEAEAGSTRANARADIADEDNKMPPFKIEGEVNLDPAEGEPTMSKDESQTVEQAVEKAILAREQRAADERKRADEVKAAEQAGYQKALDEFKTRRGAPALKRVTTRGDDNDGSAAWYHWLRTGDDRTAEMTGFKTAMNETTGANGEYLVPDGFNAIIREKLKTQSIMRRAGASTIQTSLKMVEFPIENGAAAAALTAEEGSYNQSEPTLDVKQVTVYKGTNLIKVSEELLSDSQANLDGFLQNQIVWAQATLENTWFFTGTGTGQPQGVVTGGTLGVTTAGSGAITAAEVVSLAYSLGDRYSDNACMVMARSTLGYLRGLSGNWFQLQNTPLGQPAPRAGGNEGVSSESIMGVPVYQTSAVAAIAASAKTIVMFDPAQYVILENGGLVVSRNPWLYQATGQVGIFSHFRVGGALLLSEAAYYLAQHS